MYMNVLKPRVYFASGTDGMKSGTSSSSRSGSRPCLVLAARGDQSVGATASELSIREVRAKDKHGDGDVDPGACGPEPGRRGLAAPPGEQRARDATDQSAKGRRGRDHTLVQDERVREDEHAGDHERATQRAQHTFSASQWRTRGS